MKLKRIRFNYSDYRRWNGGGEVFFPSPYLSRSHLEPPLTGTARGQRYCRSVPWHPLWVQLMSSRLEGHTLPGLLWDSRQLVIEFNTSLFSPQLCVQGPSFKLFLVTFCLAPLFLHLIYTQLQLCCSLYLGSGRETQGPSGGSLSTSVASVMEVREICARVHVLSARWAAASLQIVSAFLQVWERVEGWTECF